MSLGVDDYLRWRPADMSAAARWLSDSSNNMEMSARAFRRAAENGTAQQCGSFIDARRTEAADIADRIDRLAEVMREASRYIKTAEKELVSAVGNLRGADLDMRDAGFERAAGDVVHDTRTTYGDASDRHDREKEADYHAERIQGFLKDIRSADEMANRNLHEVVNRDVRDRTAKGNGAPAAIFDELWSLRGDHTTVPAALGSTGMQLLRDVQSRFTDANGVSLGWWNAARGGGPLISVLGFAGGVANAPEDEPINETLKAEGAGTVAGIVGAAVGFAIGGGPTAFGYVSHFLGGVGASQAASSYVRESYDREN